VQLITPMEQDPELVASASPHAVDSTNTTSRNDDGNQSQYFQSVKLGQNLKSRTLSGGVLTLALQVFKFVARFGSIAVLARLLTPADFGLVAMVTVVTGFLDTFAEGGLSVATIQREKITHAQVSTMFWYNLTISAALAVIAIVLAPVLAWTSSEPRLIPVMIVLGCAIIFNGLAFQHQALLRRNMLYGRLAIVDAVSLLIGITSAITMAWWGCGYWALVGMTTITSVSYAILIFLVTGWIPGGFHSDNDVREMLHFGVHYSGSACLAQVSQRADNVLIAYFCGVVPLALYDRSFQMMMMPIRQIDFLASSVLIPTFCRLAPSPDSLRRAILRSHALLCLSMLPPLAALVVYSDVAVAIVLGDRWSDAVPIFRLMSGAAVFMCAAKASLWAALAKGLSNKLLYYNTFGALTIVPAFLIGVYWGAIGVSIALLVHSILWAFVLIDFVRKLLDLTFAQVCGYFWIPFGLVSLLIALGFLWRSNAGATELWSLVVHAVIVSIVCYGGAGAYFLAGMRFKTRVVDVTV